MTLRTVLLSGALVFFSGVPSGPPAAGAEEIKSSWKEGKLVVETKRLRGGRVLETWERIPDGSRLIVNVKMEGGFGPGLLLKRIYDRPEGGSPR